MLKIENDRAGWDGTFALAVNLIIEDILSDGAPFVAKISRELDDGSIGTHVSTIESITAGRVKLGQRSGYVNVVDIVALEVP